MALVVKATPFYRRMRYTLQGALAQLVVYVLDGEGILYLDRYQQWNLRRCAYNLQAWPNFLACLRLLAVVFDKWEDHYEDIKSDGMMEEYGIYCLARQAMEDLL